MPLPDDEKRRIGRAIWGYSGMKQPDLAVAAGLSHDRLRAALNDENKSAPTTDELLVLAEAAGVPRHIAVDGLGADEDLREQVAGLETQVTELADGLALAAGELARHRQELAEIRAADHRGRRPGEGGRGSQ